VRSVTQPQDLVRLGSYIAVTQPPKPIWKHRGPSRRYAPPGAHSTPAPATRDGVTARPIQPRRRASLPIVVVRKTRGVFRDDERLRLSNHRKGRQADGTARVRPQSNRGWSPGAVSGAVQGDTASLRGHAIRHTLHRAYVLSTNRSTPIGRNLASVSVGTGPTPNAGKPRRSRRGGCHNCCRGNARHRTLASCPTEVRRRGRRWRVGRSCRSSNCVRRRPPVAVPPQYVNRRRRFERA